MYDGKDCEFSNANNEWWSDTYSIYDKSSVSVLTYDLANYPLDSSGSGGTLIDTSGWLELSYIETDTACRSLCIVLSNCYRYELVGDDCKLYAGEYQE